MPDDSPPPNGHRYVYRQEWDAHTEWANESMRELRRCDDRHAERIDRLERQWDRYAGPVVVLLAVLGIVATLASIASAAVVLAGR